MTSAYVTFALSAALESALSTGLIAELLPRWASAVELAERTGCDAHAAAKVLDVLVAAQLVERSGERYRLTARAREELESGPGGFGAFRALWAHTPKFLASGERFSRMDGQAQERERAYAAAVTGLAALFEPAARLLATALTPRRRIIDLGAGSGVWSLELLRVAGEGHVTALDFEGVLPCFRARAAALGLEARTSTIAGDLATAPLPPDFDRAILANVLHLEDEGGASALVAKAAEAVRADGELVIVDVLDSVGQDIAFAGYNLHLAMRTQRGVAHASATIERWLAAAGFTRRKVIDLSSALPALAAIVARR